MSALLTMFLTKTNLASTTGDNMYLLLGVILMCASAVVGFAVSHGYKKHYTFLNDFYKFLEHLESNCAFRMDSIKTVLAGQKTAYNSEFNQFLSEFEANLAQKDDFFNKWKAEQKTLDAQEAKFIGEFCSELGRLDCESQLGAIKNAKKDFEPMLASALAVVNKKGMLATKLGLILGIALLIIVL